jgi:segregation and condensation protein B
MERELIAVIGREEAPGRPLLYGTTKMFLRMFGINELGDLPKLPEMEESDI